MSRKFKRHFSTGPSGAQPPTTPLGYPSLYGQKIGTCLFARGCEPAISRKKYPSCGLTVDLRSTSYCPCPLSPRDIRVRRSPRQRGPIGEVRAAAVSFASSRCEMPFEMVPSQPSFILPRFVSGHQQDRLTDRIRLLQRHAELFNRVKGCEPQQVFFEGWIKRSAQPLPCGSRTNAGELSIPQTVSSS
jgi:hypothetical protein